MENNYGTRVKSILNRLGEVAEKVGENYFDVNVPGLTKVSVNAHELNTMISLLKNNGFHNKDIHVKIILTCARILEVFEEAEEQDRLEKEKLAAQEQKDKESEGEAESVEDKETPSSSGRKPRKKKTDAKNTPTE